MKWLLTGVLALAAVGKAIDLRIPDSGGNGTSPFQYGVMFEEIDHSGEGGLYAELLQNRAFQFDSFDQARVDPWLPVGAGTSLSLQNSGGLSSALPFYIKASCNTNCAKSIGLSNPGFWGIKVQPQDYTGSFWVKGKYSGNFVASLSAKDGGQVWATTNIKSRSTANGWTQHNFTLTPSSTAPDTNNVLSITFSRSGSSSLNFALLSLFPPTWGNRPNGFRKDLMDNIKALNPSFLRFPGGSNLIGPSAPNHWRWKDTIGPLQDRPGYSGFWNYENTNGMGLAEFLNWCEDFQMEPILAVWAGAYTNGVVDDDEVAAVLQDAMDELEYVLGSTDTRYGALRASHGRQAPWRVRYVEVGNEDWNDSYQDNRWPKFYRAIKDKYPDMNVISSSLNFALNDDALGDFHLYARPDYLVGNFGLFDQLTPNHKLLVGELADLQYNNGNRNDSADFGQEHIPFPFWAGSVAEAIFMLGLERNTDKVLGTTFFSLLANVDGTQWSPGMICYNADPAQDLLTTSYQIFKLFSNNRMTETLPVKAKGDFGPAYWVAGKNTQSNKRILKAAVYNSTEPVSFTVGFNAVKGSTKGTLTTLTSQDPFGMVSVGQNPVITKVTQLTAKNGVFSFQLPNLSVAVLTI